MFCNRISDLESVPLEASETFGRCPSPHFLGSFIRGQVIGCERYLLGLQDAQVVFWRSEMVRSRNSVILVLHTNLASFSGLAERQYWSGTTQSEEGPWWVSIKGLWENVTKIRLDVLQTKSGTNQVLFISCPILPQRCPNSQR